MLRLPARVHRVQPWAWCEAGQQDAGRSSVPIEGVVMIRPICPVCEQQDDESWLCDPLLLSCPFRIGPDGEVTVHVHVALDGGVCSCGEPTPAWLAELVSDDVP